MRWGCSDVISGGVSDGLELWLVFGVGLEAGRCFKVVVVAFRALFV